MRVVIAPDSFKESLGAREVAHAIEGGFRDVFPDWTYAVIPVADGGEGTLDALIDATGGERIACTVTGPMGAPVEAVFGITGDGRGAIIEMAAASGLMLVPPAKRDPMRATTYGVGELIVAALDRGVRDILIGIGGSATNDGGAGMAQSLGVRLLDAAGRDIERGGGGLGKLARIDVSGIDPRVAESRVRILSDVDNPLVGPRGASAVFGPQKGATPAQVEQLDANLRRYAERIEADLGITVADRPGAGAAGGLGAGLLAFCRATMGAGIDMVADLVGLDAAIAGADLVITGEGRIDGQTVHGKTPIGVARVAQRHGKPVIAIAGTLGVGAEQTLGHGIDAMFSIIRQPCTLPDALAAASENIRAAARNVAAAIKIGLVHKTGRDGNG
ncbi:glycerate kinase [Sphingomonas montanisoli]|uniref:Glycerate kinase n=1 Tax=Sphingomonas montanisoli TaxID=2606412 RepID=A0A5D9CBA9_9SPHN|nr:glycerate kinase [Sphingomonas montanisoli]TZG29248.1 glycerate kinase [Sphingomonas montanisoli]